MKHCRDGGVCHHNCISHCFREACCEPLTDSHLNWNWTPKTRLLRRYRGHVIKIWHNDVLHATMLKEWTVECKIDGGYIGTSFRSFAAALAAAKSSIDVMIARAPMAIAIHRASSYVRLQAVVRRLERKAM